MLNFVCCSYFFSFNMLTESEEFSQLSSLRRHCSHKTIFTSTAITSIGAPHDHSVLIVCERDSWSSLKVIMLMVRVHHQEMIEIKISQGQTHTGQSPRKEIIVQLLLSSPRVAMDPSFSQHKVLPCGRLTWAWLPEFLLGSMTESLLIILMTIWVSRFSTSGHDMNPSP